MNDKYKTWIADYERRMSRRVVGEPDVPTGVRGTCGEATREMVAAFPELRRVRGRYGGAEHWWCVTADGEVVDPTAAQFLPGAAYREHRDGVDPEPIGKCMNCGDYIWTAGWSGCCSKECCDELTDAYGT